MAQESTVLLKNKGGLLPLGNRGGRTIGVLGYAANPLGASNVSGGGGSSKGSGVPTPVSPLEGITQLAQAHGDRILYSDGSAGADAAAVAAASDVVVAFASDSEVEGGDRGDLGLHPGLCPFPVCISIPSEDQNAMVAAAVKANPKTIVVVNAGAPFSAPWVSDVPAILDAFYPGTENGNAIAAIVYGEVNPSGKLPQTFPKSLADMPANTPAQFPGIGLKAKYSEQLDVGYRHFDARGIEPLWPFGFGLSYTTFKLGDLEVTPRQATSARVRFSITNTGARTGAEVGQVYVGFPASTGEPPRQLKGFSKLELGPGESGTATVDLPARAFSIYDVAKKGWVQRRGCYTINVGTSSRDLPLRGTVPILGGSPRSVRVLVRNLRGRRIRSARVYVNGKRQRAKHTARTVTVRLNGRADGTAKVRIVVTTTSGRKLTVRRAYRLCGSVP
jgi:beta-glucosidase